MPEDRTPYTARPKIVVPLATIARLRDLERTMDLAEDRMAKLRNLRTALTNLFPPQTRDHGHYMKWIETALSNVGAIEQHLRVEWGATLPEEALSVDDLEAWSGETSHVH